MTSTRTAATSGLLAALLLSVLPLPGDAANGAISVSWGTCSPVVSDLSATAGPASLIVSQIGNDQTHNVYQVRFLLGDAQNTVPDAWRFDADGCQSAFPGSLTMSHIPPASVAKSCPSFQGLANSIQIKTYSLMHPGTNYPTTMIRGVLASGYPAGMTSLATQRYFLAEFRFDHATSVNGAGTPGVSCGGLETPMVFQLLYGPPTEHGDEGTSSYARMSDGMEFGFDPGAVTATVNATVPAERSTWGQIKGTYRR